MKNINPVAKLTQFDEFNSYLRNNKLMRPMSPISMEISLTGLCNASCPWCFYKDDQRDQANINGKYLIKFVNNIPSLKSVSFVGGGEPTIHPKFRKISESIVVKKALITNGIRVPDMDYSSFTWIRVSKTDRPFNVDALRALRGAGTLGLAVNYTGTSRSYDQCVDAAQIAHEVGADYVQVRPALQTKGNLTFIEKPSFQDPIIHVMGYKFNDCDKYHGYKKCRAFHFVPFLWHNGNLSVCCYHKDKYTLGNIYHQSEFYFPIEVNVCDDCQVCCKLHEMNKFIDNCKSVVNKEWP